MRPVRTIRRQYPHIHSSSESPTSKVDMADRQSLKPIERNLQNEARRADMVMIWTDCDREGEHIGSEVADVCRKSNRNIIVKRARFSAIIAA
jgi:DNA topoisomerase IA